MTQKAQRARSSSPCGPLPTHRQHGIGRLLVNAVLDWAGRHGVKTLKLMVTSKNHSAMQSLSAMGFTMTGRAEPYPNDAELMEFEMAKSIAGDGNA